MNQLKRLKMAVNKLLGTELAYELRIQNISLPDNVTKKRALRLERENGPLIKINIHLIFFGRN